jgi:hypothetical protein
MAELPTEQTDLPDILPRTINARVEHQKLAIAHALPLARRIELRAKTQKSVVTANSNANRPEDGSSLAAWSAHAASNAA